MFTGIYTFGNRGVEAFTLPVIEATLAACPHAQISLVTQLPNDDASAVSHLPVRLVQGGKNDIIMRNRWMRWFLITAMRMATGARLCQLLRRMLPRPLRKVCDQVLFLDYIYALRDATTVISLGGDVFTMDYGKRQLRQQVMHMTLATDMGKKTGMIGHSIGPFSEAWEKALVQKMLSGMTFVTIRESLTQRYLSDAFGYTQSVTLADPAFALLASSEESRRQLMATYGISTGMPYIVIAPSNGIQSYLGVSAQDKHAVVRWRRVIEWCLHLGVQVVIIPHVQTPNASNDLTEALRQKASFNDVPRVIVVDGGHSAAEYKSLIAGGEMILAERMHAAIAGLSSGVCTVAIGYSVKARGIMMDLFGERCDEFGLHVPFAEFVDPERFTQDRFYALWRKRDEVKALLKQAIPEQLRQAGEGYRLLLAMHLQHASAQRHD